MFIKGEFLLSGMYIFCDVELERLGGKGKELVKVGGKWGGYRERG